MPVFRQYNVQLLPLDTRATPEVGEIGYQRLFQALKDWTANAQRQRALTEGAFVLPNDTYFAPFTVTAPAKYARGKWVKYHRAESVHDLYTNESLYTAESGSDPVSNSFLFRFLFDYRTHRLAIEENGSRLPSPVVLERALDHLLRPLADENFPKHVLKINLVSQTKALEEALAEAEGFRRVDVKVTFANGHELSQRLKDMKAKNVHIVEVKASSDKDGLMPTLPDFILDLVRAAPDYGRALFTYLKVGASKRTTFSTLAYPLKLRFREKTAEPEAAFLDRVWAAMWSPAEKRKPRNIDDAL